MPHCDDIIQRTDRMPGQHGDRPRQEEDRGEEAGAPAVRLEEPGEEQGQEELHVDGDPHVHEVLTMVWT